jgi:hypothetical protein
MFGVGNTGRLSVGSVRRRAALPALPPLDLITAPSAGAWSVSRLLRTAYNGPALRLRRDVDNVERDVFQAAGLVQPDALLGVCGTNHLPNSETITAAAGWTPTGLVTSQIGTAGADAVWDLREDTANNRHRIASPLLTATAGQAARFVFEARAAGAPFVQLLCNAALTPARTNINLLTGEIVNSLPIAPTITMLPDGWVRVDASFTVATGNGAVLVQLIQSMSDPRDPASYVGNPARGVELRRIQVQFVTTPPGYCPTFGTAVTAVSSGFVVTEYDQSGNGRNVTQATALNQIRLVNAGVLDTRNSRPAPVFAGNQWLERSEPDFLYAPGAATVCAVVAGPAQVDMRIVAHGSTVNTAPIYAPTQTASPTTTALSSFLRNDAGNSPIIPNGAQQIPGAFDDTLRVMSTIDTGTQFRHAVNGALGTNISYTRIGVLTLNRFAIGALARGSVTNIFTGTVPEVIVFASALSAADRQTLERNQGAHYGITVA